MTGPSSPRTGAASNDGPLDLRVALARVVDGRSLTRDEMRTVTLQLLDGGATAAQTGALLAALRAKGEHGDELAGVADALRSHAIAVRCNDALAVDTCGTGGDGAHTINISTIAAFVVAGCGVTVAKHGNRAASSRCGSADVLEALGVRTEVDVPTIEACLAELGIAFLFAPAFHPVLRQVAPVRKELGFRTIFNLVGPLANPARVRRQVVGVFDESRLEPMAVALGELGAVDALVVHGVGARGGGLGGGPGGGMDELAVDGETRAVRWRNGALERLTLRPGDFGLTEGDPQELVGGDAVENAATARAVLQGERAGAARTAVVLAAAAALVVADRALDWHSAARLAEESIDDGAAWDKLQGLIARTQQSSPAP